MHINWVNLLNKKANCTHFFLLSQATTKMSPIIYTRGIMTLRLIPIQDGHLPDEVWDVDAAIYRKITVHSLRQVYFAKNIDNLLVQLIGYSISIFIFIQHYVTMFVQSLYSTVWWHLYSGLPCRPLIWLTLLLYYPCICCHSSLW